MLTGQYSVPINYGKPYCETAVHSILCISLHNGLHLYAHRLLYKQHMSSCERQVFNIYIHFEV